MNTVIASKTYIAIDRDGRTFPITVEIGLPERYPPDHQFAGLTFCPISLDGLETRVAPAMADSAMQTLSLALRFARTMLGALLDRGGRLFDKEEYQERGEDAMEYTPAALDAVYGCPLGKVEKGSNRASDIIPS